MDLDSLRVHFVEGYIQTIVLIEQEGGLLLFDSGCINDVKRIQRYCREKLHCAPSRIKLTAVTHMHPDHAGGAVCLRKRYGIPIAAHKDVDRWYRGPSGLLQHKLDCYMASLVAVRNNRRLEPILYRRKLNPDYPLEDGQHLPFFPEWKVLHVPGHIAHDLVFYHQKEQVLYTADLICDVKGQPHLPLPIVFPQKMAESYERLASLPVRVILRAHGQPIFTENNTEIFVKMKELLNRPPTPFVKRIWRLSKHSPEIKKLNYK